MWRRENYKDDKRHGMSEGWYGDGEMAWRLNFKDGKRHGMSEGWQENGLVAWRENYKDDLLVDE